MKGIGSGESELVLPGMPATRGVADLAWPTEPLPGAPLPAARMAGFTTSLFIQASADEAMNIARIVEHTGVGAVVTIERGRVRTPLQQARAAVECIRQRTLSPDILVDHNLYSSKRRKQAADGITRRWIDDQHMILGLTWAVTDSGFCHSLADVQHVLAEAASLDGNIITALPVPFGMVRDEADGLTAAINKQPHPVALILEHELDPFDETGVAAGIHRIITASQPGAGLLRSDTSALGVAANGGIIGAVGARSGQRHVYPSDIGGGPAHLSFVVPELLGYYTHDRFQRAYFSDPTLPAWRCGCWFCAGRELTWIGAQSADLQHAAAFQHSAAALAGVAQWLASPVIAENARVWSVLCGRALRNHDQIPNPSGSPWEPKPALSHWRDLSRQLTKAS